MKQEAKLVYLLECLQKTAPPVLIFAEKQTDVDDVHEYLMSKDVDAVAVHGQKTQEERAEAIDQFKVWSCTHLAQYSSCDCIGLSFSLTHTYIIVTMGQPCMGTSRSPEN